MNTIASNLSNLRNEVERLENALAAKRRELDCLIINCPHQWTAIVPDHIYTPGYTIPGDPPGVGGVDHQFPCYVDSKTEKRWKRTCVKCGKIEHTSKVKQTISENPEF